MEDVTLLGIMAAIIFAGADHHSEAAGYSPEAAASKAFDVLAAVNRIVRNPHSHAAEGEAWSGK